MTAARCVAASAFLAAAMAFQFGAIAAAETGASQARLALVVGESGYPQAPLPTAAADAGLMATALAQAGFDVTAVADAGAAPLRRTIAAFVARVRASGPGTSVVVYVSGDGLQYGGENWLAPVDVRIDRAADIPTTAVRLADLTGPLEAVPARTRLFLFDLARETPFAREDSSPASGLALVDAPVGSVYAFNTAPGAVALPDVPPYGAYARSLAEAMQEPGLTLGRVLQRVRLRVGERTDGAAVPFDDGAADSAFAFVPGPAAAPAPRPAIGSLPAAEAYSAAIAQDTLPGYVDFLAAYPHDPLSPRIRAMAAVRREAQVWSEAVRDNTPRAYWTYIRRYPRGPHRLDVRQKLDDLHAALEPPPRFDIVAFEGLPPPPQGDAAILDQPFPNFSDSDGPAIPAPPQTLLPPPRAAFFETLPPAPPAPPGALPLPLPVDRPPGDAMPFGRVAESEGSAGALVTTSVKGRTGTALVTSKADGTVLYRVYAQAAHDTRTIDERTAGGDPITTVTITTGKDGGSTMSFVGPQNALISRSVSRDAARGGGRVTTLFDAAELPVATTIVSPDGIVVAQGLIPGRTAPRRLVLASHLDAKGNPVFTLEPEAEIKLPSRPALANDAGKADAGKADAGKADAGKADAGKADAGRSDAGRSDAGRSDAGRSDAGKADAATPDPTLAPPALPIVPGLTGQAPALNLPPAPSTPAFDATAAPVAPPPSEGVPVTASKPNTNAGATLAAPTPAPAAATPAPAGPSVAGPVTLPTSPPLPPPRAAEVRTKKRTGR